MFGILKKKKQATTSSDADNEHKHEAMKDNIEMCIDAPFWERISNSKRILLSGCGGGYDVYQAIPLYFALRAKGYEVFLANYTFCTDIKHEKAMEMWYSSSKKDCSYPSVVVVSAKKVRLKKVQSTSYFPEYYLSLYFAETLNSDVPIYTFPRYGFVPLCRAYELLVDRLDIDTVITIDGGTDSLMKGNEYEVGTVQEDYNSIFAVQSIKSKKVKQKMLICLGMGVDRFHGVSDVSTLRAIAELTQTNSYLGCIHLLPTQKPVIRYREAGEFAFERMQVSIVAASILTAVSGKFGNQHWPNNYRTKGSKLFINPLMCIYFIFDIDGVFQRIHKKFKTEFAKAMTSADVHNAVQIARISIQESDEWVKKHENYPATNDLRENQSDPKDEEIERLQREIEKLKKENEQLRNNKN